MSEAWDLAKVQQYIDNGIEESLTLDYKAAGALEKTDRKKKEITKDISAMANAAGGIIIYGVQEHNTRDKEHLPEKIDSIDRTQFPKEWLEQIINTIQPRIDGIRIHPVDVHEASNQVIYIVEIPQSTTAHQARDYRYYKRHNFLSQPMEHYEIKDIMNRGIMPDAEVEFGYKVIQSTRDKHKYQLGIIVRNHGAIAINNFKIEFTFPNYAGFNNLHSEHRHLFKQGSEHENITYKRNEAYDHVIAYRSKHLIFPKDKVDVGADIQWRYSINYQTYLEIRKRNMALTWTLHADNMPPKHGQIPFHQLHEYQTTPA